MSEETKFEFRKVAQGKTFKWMVFFFALYLIVIGSMLVYESTRDAQFDTSINYGLIGVGAAALVLSGIILIAMVFVEKQYPSISIYFFYAVVVMVMFGTAVGTLSVINGVDVPNLGSRGTLGWIFGGITTGVGVIGTLWTIFALIMTYNPKLAKRHSYFAQWAVINEKRPQSIAEMERENEDIEPKSFSRTKAEEDFYS